MLYLGGLLATALLLTWLFCIIDVIMTPDAECRYLPKLVWLGIVIVLGDLGSATWLLVGRPWPGGSPLERAGFGSGARGRARSGDARPATAFPEYDRPDRFAATNPDDDEAFLAQVRARAEEQRRVEARRKREREEAEIAERERRREARGGPSGPGPVDPGPADGGPSAV